MRTTNYYLDRKLDWFLNHVLWTLWCSVCHNLPQARQCFPQETVQNSGRMEQHRLLCNKFSKLPLLHSHMRDHVAGIFQLIHQFGQWNLQWTPKNLQWTSSPPRSSVVISVTVIEQNWFPCYIASIRHLQTPLIGPQLPFSCLGLFKVQLLTFKV